MIRFLIHRFATGCDPFCYKRWYEFIALFCISFFVASGKAAGLLEPNGEALSSVAFLVSLKIEPTSSVALVPIGGDSGREQSARGGTLFVRHH
jgi:hypothetical protein